MKAFILIFAINIFMLVSQVNAKYTDALEKVEEGVVRLWVDEGQGKYSTGSAFSINDDGYFVTNHHVIESALSGKKLVVIESIVPDPILHPATVVWSSAAKDLAIIRVTGWQRPPLTLASSENVKKGQRVISIGFPGASDKLFGVDNPGYIEPKTKEGIISALTTIFSVNGVNVSLFEHDATINGGSSGGPLVNECGWIVGINVFKLKSILSADEIVREISSGIISFDVEEGTFFSIQTNELIEELDKLGIKYKIKSSCVTKRFDEDLFILLLLTVLILAIAGFIYLRKHLSKKVTVSDSILKVLDDLKKPRKKVDADYERDSRGKIIRRRESPEPNEQSNRSIQLIPKKKNLNSIDLACNGTYIIGRDRNKVQIEFEHEKVSRVHAKIEVSDAGEVRVIDLGSRNGTYIDHKRVGTEHWETVNPEQQLRLGTDEVVYVLKKGTNVKAK